MLGTLLENSLAKVFRKFLLDEIANDIVPLIPRMSLEYIKKGLRSYKLKCTAENVGKIVIHYLKDKGLDIVSHLYNRILLLNVALHHSEKWIPYSLLKPIAQVNITTTGEMERLVLQAVRIEKMNADIYSHYTGNLFYVMVVNKQLTRRNGVKLTAPLYFCKSNEDPYLFLVDKQHPQFVIPMILKTFGFEKCKKHALLSGKDIQSLIVTLKNKNSAVQVEELEFQVMPTVGHQFGFVVNNAERLRHARHYLGDNKVVLEEMTINGPPEFMGKMEAYSMKPFKTSMVIRSRNVRESLELLAWKGAIKPPFPMYMKKLNVIGKNKITMKSGPTN